MQAKLDVFQLKGLRRTLHTIKTYHNRNDTNAKVYKHASEIIGKPFRPLSDVYVYNCRKIKRFINLF